MYFIIPDFDSNNIDDRQAFEFILSEFIKDFTHDIDNYIINSDIEIDLNKGILYCKKWNDSWFDPFKLISELLNRYPSVLLYIVISIEYLPEYSLYEQGLDHPHSELLFALFFQNKVSYYKFNYDFTQFDAPKLYSYFKFIFHNSENSFPYYFNKFISQSEFYKFPFLYQNEYSSKLLGHLNKLNDSFKDFLENHANQYLNVRSLDEIYQINTFNNYDWLMPSDEFNKLNNLNMINDNVPLSLYQHSLLEKIFTNKRNNKYSIVIDTETTGLPSDTNEIFPYLNYPEPVQISWLVFDEYDRIVEYRDFIIKPNDYVIPRESTAIHRISHEYAINNGSLIENVLSKLNHTLTYCDIIIGHNLEFDIKVIEKAGFIFSYNKDKYSDWEHYGLINSKKIERFCTMKESMPMLKNNNINKYPKLSELFEIIFNKQASGIHNSSKDIFYTFEIYKYIANSLI